MTDPQAPPRSSYPEVESFRALIRAVESRDPSGIAHARRELAGFVVNLRRPPQARRGN